VNGKSVPQVNGVNGKPQGGQQQQHQQEYIPYTYANGAERQAMVNEVLSMSMSSYYEEGPPFQASESSSAEIPRETSAAPPTSPSTDDLKRQLILDAAKELERELSLAGEELAEARQLRLTAAQLVEEGRMEAERQWRGAVEELESRATLLGGELATLRKDQLRLQEEAIKDRAALSLSLEQVKAQLEAQSTVVASERDRSEKLEEQLESLRGRQEIADRERSLEKLKFASEVQKRDALIDDRDKEIQELRGQLSDTRSLAKLLVKATCADLGGNRKILADRVKNRLVIGQKIALVATLACVLAVAPVVGPKIAITLGSASFA